MPPNNLPQGTDMSSQIFPQRTNGVQPPPTNTPPPSPPIPPRSQFSGGTNFASPKKSSKLGLFVVLVLILLIGGAGAYAYTQDLWFFAAPPYDENQLASSIFKGVGNIKTSSYALNLQIKSGQKEADAEPFTMAVSSTEKLEAYKRDYDKGRDIEIILGRLAEYNQKNGFFPNDYKGIGDNIVPKPAYVYVVKPDKKNFTLSVAFETGDAIESIVARQKNGTTTLVKVSNKTIIFDKDVNRYLYMPGQPKQPSFANILNLQNYATMIPGNFELNGTLEGASEKQSDNSVNGRVHIFGSAGAGDVNASLDAEFRKFGDNFYILVSKMPSIFADISKLKEKWIEVTPADVSSYGGGYFGIASNESADELTKRREQAVESMKLFLSIADENRALRSKSDAKQERVNGVTAYKYELQFDKEVLPKFYSDLTTEFTKKFGDKSPVKFDAATLDYLKSPEFDSVFNYFRKNTTLTLWADKNGTPLKVVYALRVVPEAKGQNAADKQINIQLTLSLNDINQPVIIEKPATSMSVEDATIALTGVSKEQYRFSKQTSAVYAVKNAIVNYHRIVGAYPNSLDDLKKTRGELKKISTVSAKDKEMNSYLIFGDDSQPLIKNVPLDTVSGKPFVYENKGKDFALTYTIQLPVYVKGTVPSQIYTTDYSSMPNVRIPFATPRTNLIMSFVNGKNTADSKSTSVEAAAQSKIDSDTDGLPDVLETYLGTNHLKKDTDGDGQSDGEELRVSTNPSGPGNLERSRYGY